MYTLQNILKMCVWGNGTNCFKHGPLLEMRVSSIFARRLCCANCQELLKKVCKSTGQGRAPAYSLVLHCAVCLEIPSGGSGINHGGGIGGLYPKVLIGSYLSPKCKNPAPEKIFLPKVIHRFSLLSGGPSPVSKRPRRGV